MKSVISNHEASKEEVLRRINFVVLHGDLNYYVEIGGLRIVTCVLGDNKYNISYLNESVLTFELENVYCFKF